MEGIGVTEGGGLHGRRILHVGCGSAPLPEWLSGEETRLDINPACNPDIVAPMDDIGDVGEFDVVYSSHSLEHLTKEGALRALKEFHRVLTDGGAAIVIVPDLEDIKPNDEVMYVASCGPITGLDMFYGHQPSVETNPHMAHRTGFSRKTLGPALNEAGFSKCRTMRMPGFNLLGVGVK